MTASLRQRLIRYFCAKDKNTGISDELLTACFHAFEGSFAGGVPFTLYAPLADKLVLFTRRTATIWETPGVYSTTNAESIVESLSEIAGAYRAGGTGLYHSGIFRERPERTSRGPHKELAEL
jgi:hypothetical protein